MAKIRRLLILGDKGDPVMPEEACRRFAKGVKNSKVIVVYNEGRHHPIGKDALKRYAVPFLHNKPLSAADAMRNLFSSVREWLRASLRDRRGRMTFQS